MNFRPISVPTETIFQEVLIPHVTTRQNTILIIAFSVLAFLAACFLARSCLRNRIVKIEEEKKNTANPVPPILSEIFHPVDNELPPSDVAKSPEEKPHKDPSEQIDVEDDDKKASRSPIPSPPASALPFASVASAVVSPSVIAGLDRESVQRIINYSQYSSDPISVEACEAFAPDLLKFIEDREVQKEIFFWDSELPEGVRTVCSDELENYLQQDRLNHLIDPTLRLLVLKGTLKWYGGHPRSGVYAGLDLEHKLDESGCLTRDDLIQLDITMQKECWKEGDLDGLTPEETVIYGKAIKDQNKAVYNRFLDQNQHVVIMGDDFTLLNRASISLLQKLVKMGKIHAYNFNAKNSSCQCMLTAHDEPLFYRRLNKMLYQNWVDQALLQNFDNRRILPLSSNPSAFESKVLEKISENLFSRLTNNRQAAFELSSNSVTEALNIEEILQRLVQAGQIHSYAKDQQAFYLRITAQDNVEQMPSPLGWVDSDVLQKLRK